MRSSTEQHRGDFGVNWLQVRVAWTSLACAGQPRLPMKNADHAAVLDAQPPGGMVKSDSSCGIMDGSFTADHHASPGG